MPARDHAASRSDRASVPPARLPDADLGPDIELPAIEIAIIARREGRPLVGEVVDARPQREIRKFILDRDRMPRVARDVRSEERRVGKEGVSTCRSRWSSSHEQKKRDRTLYSLQHEPNNTHE